MQMMGFLYCLKMVSSCVGVWGPQAPPPSHGCTSAPGALEAPRDSHAPACALSLSVPRGVVSLSGAGQETGHETVRGHGADVAVTSCCLPLAGYLFSDVLSNLQKPLFLHP